MGKEHPELLPLAGHILKAFYDADILDEEAILEWGAKVCVCVCVWVGGCMCVCVRPLPIYAYVCTHALCTFVMQSILWLCGIQSIVSCVWEYSGPSFI